MTPVVVVDQVAIVDVLAFETERDPPVQERRLPAAARLACYDRTGWIASDPE